MTVDELELDRVLADRARQGFPECVEDQAAAARVANLLDAAAERPT